MKKSTAVMTAAGVMLALAIVGRMDAAEQERQMEQYCHDVALFRAQATVPKPIRDGHPDYDGIAQHCPAE